MYIDSITKRVGERKRFSFITKDASDDGTVMTILIAGRVYEITPRLLWNNWAKICEFLGPENDAEGLKSSLNGQMYYHISENLVEDWFTKSLDEEQRNKLATKFAAPAARSISNQLQAVLLSIK